MPEKYNPKFGNENIKPIGETWGEKNKRIILEKVEESGPTGFSVDDVLPMLRKDMYAHERAIGGDPEKLTDDILDTDDVGSALLELNKEGVIEIKEGRIYMAKK